MRASHTFELKINTEHHEPQSPGATQGVSLDAPGAAPALNPSTEQMFHMMRNLITSQVQEMTIGIRTDKRIPMTL